MNQVTKEEIKLDISVGDVILTGKFRNKRAIVKSIGKDELGQPTVNGKPLLKVRIEKDLPEDKQSKETKEKNNKMKVTKEQIRHIIKEVLKESFASFDDFDGSAEEEEHKVEAQVFGDRKRGSNKKYVEFYVTGPMPEIKKLKIMAIKAFFAEGGFGDDPFVNFIAVDDGEGSDQQSSLFESEKEEVDNIDLKKIVNAISSKLRKPEYYEPRTHKTIGGGWTADTYRLGPTVVRLEDEGYSTVIINKDIGLFIYDTINKPVIFKQGSQEDLLKLYREIAGA